MSRFLVRLRPLLGIVALLGVTCSQPSQELHPPSLGPDAIPAPVPSVKGMSINVVLNIPLSGSGAAALLSEQNGALMGIDEVNGKGGVLGRPLAIVFEDAGMAPDQNRAAYLRALAQNPIAIFLSSVSSQNFAVSGLVQDAQMPTLLNGAHAQLTRQGIPWVFRVQASDDLLSSEAARFAVQELKATRIALFYANDELGVSAAWAAQEALKVDFGLTPASRVSFPPGEKDLSKQLNELKRASPQVILVFGAPVQIVTVMKQVKQAGLALPLLTTASALSPTTLDLVTDSEAEGWYVVTAPLPMLSRDPKTQDWVHRYQERFKTDPDSEAAMYYDAVLILADAIKRAGSFDRTQVMKALLQTASFRGVATTYTFDVRGDGAYSVQVVQIRGKTPRLVGGRSN